MNILSRIMNFLKVERMRYLNFYNILRDSAMSSLCLGGHLGWSHSARNCGRSLLLSLILYSRVFLDGRTQSSKLGGLCFYLNTSCYTGGT